MRLTACCLGTKFIPEFARRGSRNAKGKSGSPNVTLFLTHIVEIGRLFRRRKRRRTGHTCCGIARITLSSSHRVDLPRDSFKQITTWNALPSAISTSAECSRALCPTSTTDNSPQRIPTLFRSAPIYPDEAWPVASIFEALHSECVYPHLFCLQLTSWPQSCFSGSLIASAYSAPTDQWPRGRRHEMFRTLG
jgi:hypothetical protein